MLFETRPLSSKKKKKHTHTLLSTFLNQHNYFASYCCYYCSGDCTNYRHCHLDNNNVSTTAEEHQLNMWYCSLNLPLSFIFLYTSFNGCPSSSSSFPSQLCWYWGWRSNVLLAALSRLGMDTRLSAMTKLMAHDPPPSFLLYIFTYIQTNVYNLSMGSMWRGSNHWFAVKHKRCHKNDPWSPAPATPLHLYAL